MHPLSQDRLKDRLALTPGMLIQDMLIDDML
jgi:hypothetical protein